MSEEDDVERESESLIGVDRRDGSSSRSGILGCRTVR